MSYPKYAWLANKVTKQQMSQLVRIRDKSGKPLTQILKEAVDGYLKKR